MSATCGLTGCDHPSRSRGLCKSHYDKLRRNGELQMHPPGDTEDRFWSKVDKTSTCWNWVGAKGEQGYGMFWFDGRVRGAHRVSFILHNGSIADGLEVDHQCHNPSCVRPSHLRAVTVKQNCENRGKNNSHNTAGFHGVHWCKRDRKFIARITHNGTRRILGYFDTAEEAGEVARQARLELFTHNDIDRVSA